MKKLILLAAVAAAVTVAVVRDAVPVWTDFDRTC